MYVHPVFCFIYSLCCRLKENLHLTDSFADGEEKIVSLQFPSCLNVLANSNDTSEDFLPI